MPRKNERKLSMATEDDQTRRFVAIDREKLHAALVALRMALARYPDPRAEMAAAIEALEEALWSSID